VEEPEEQRPEEQRPEERSSGASKKSKTLQDQTHSVLRSLLAHPYLWFLLGMVLWGIGMAIQAALTNIANVPAIDLILNTPVAANILFLLQGIVVLAIGVALVGIFCYMTYLAVKNSPASEADPWTNPDSYVLTPAANAPSHSSWLFSQPWRLLIYAPCLVGGLTILVLSIGFFANPAAFNFMQGLLNFMGSGIAAVLKSLFGGVSEEMLSTFLLIGQIYATVVLTLLPIAITAVSVRVVNIVKVHAESKRFYSIVEEDLYAETKVLPENQVQFAFSPGNIVQAYNDCTMHRYPETDPTIFEQINSWFPNPIKTWLVEKWTVLEVLAPPTESREVKVRIMDEGFNDIDESSTLKAGQEGYIKIGCLGRAADNREQYEALAHEQASVLNHESEEKLKISTNPSSVTTPCKGTSQGSKTISSTC
jgi:hypothetical protein